MKYSMRGAVAVAAAAGIMSAASAQFANNCGNAPTVGEGVFAFNLANATNDFAGPCGLTETAPDQWVRYVPAGNGTVTISTCGLSAGDTVITVLNGECGAAVLGCSDDDCGFTLQSSVTFPVAVGNVYMVRIAGFNGERPNGQVAISRPNDNCSDATNVSAGLYAFDNSGANTDGGGSCGFNNGHDIWYRFTAPGRGNLSVNTCEGTGFDTVLTAFTGCGGAEVACNDDTCGLRSAISVNNMVLGQTVTVRLAGYNQLSGSGNIRFAFDSVDDCSDAVDLGDGTYAFNNTQAANDGQESCGGSYDLWYRHHSAGMGWLDVTTCGLTGMDTTLSLVNGCGGGTIDCNDDACGLQSYITTPVLPGSTSLVRLAGWAGSRGSGQVRFAVRTNDSCSNAYPVADGVYPFDNTAATQDGPSVCGLSGNNVWYRYVGPALGRVRVTTCGLTVLDTVLTAFDGCGGNVLACTDDSCFLQTVIEPQVQAGQPILISLGGFDGERGTGQVSFEFIPCRIDFNGDGFVDFFDYDDYVNCFETGNCPPGKTADFNGDNFVDFFDYDDFVANFEAGC
jgi:hypothetical protein